MSPQSVVVLISAPYCNNKVLIAWMLLCGSLTASDRAVWLLQCLIVPVPFAGIGSSTSSLFIVVTTWRLLVDDADNSRRLSFSIPTCSMNSILPSLPTYSLPSMVGVVCHAMLLGMGPTELMGCPCVFGCAHRCSFVKSETARQTKTP